MRRIQLFGAAALAAMAALSLSCSKTDAVDAPGAPHPVSFELGLGEPGTKVSITAETDGLKSAWEVGDEISVFWMDKDGFTPIDQYETFTVTAVSADGKTATFSNASSAMPSDCTLGIYYPARNHGGDGYKYLPYTFATNYGGVGVPNDDVKLSNAGKWALYGASGVVVTGGVIPAVSLAQKSSFLLIRAGTVIDGLTSNAFFDFEGLHYMFRANPNESKMQSFTGFHLASMNITTSNTVPFDMYVPFVADGTDQTVTVILKSSGSSAVLYTKSLGTKALQPGKVYDISAKLNGVASD